MLFGYRVTTERIYIPEATLPAAPAKADAKEKPVEMLRRIDDLWMKVETVLWHALRPFTEAREAVSKALDDMEPLPVT